MEVILKMNFSIMENKARELSVTLATEPLPKGVKGILLSRCQGAVSIVSGLLDETTAQLVHALNLGKYQEILNNQSGYCLKYAISLYPDREKELIELNRTLRSNNSK